ncbi:hydroxymethylglutaryl-CoA reductase [Catalinimonas niigatensis]|uniref:hydroxymethylglutaryl-CoA reductase n=1 Tax=Catalinimonas niigatensis TaxID=1397264 RepID=UPI002665BD82|nr:hydroxymethylglutaryl-CoA reductase [Catalinimonas niigatensis]WPP49114.1 hydroxymethylglutaryl-CoA reductase [Catalinimonas niigatensis]
MNASLTKVLAVSINGEAIDLTKVGIVQGDQAFIDPISISAGQPLEFPLGNTLHIHIDDHLPGEGSCTFHIHLHTQPFGELRINFEDNLNQRVIKKATTGVPRSGEDDYSDRIIQERIAFTEAYTGRKVTSLKRHALNPKQIKGNCENFIGAAQIPLGLAGPIRINGEWAQGEFLVPLATSEGTLVASYNRGIKIVNLCGGVTTTVSEDLMQRAPVFVFDNARQARSFSEWIDIHFTEIQQKAGASSQYAHLVRIESYLSNTFAFLRFNFRTGDAAGQNMVTKATYEACLWIIENCPVKSAHFYLESNMATDKKPSFINSLQGRGKRVTAEIIFKKEILERELRVSANQLGYHQAVANIGALLAGSNNNGLHSVNAITALFIATGQDVATVAESSACLTHVEVLPNGDLSTSLTLPSLVVGTFGGGTGLPTQRECLEMMDCYGEGKAKKLAEIIAGVVLAGEISLAAAISSADWVSSHEAMGRNK